MNLRADVVPTLQTLQIVDRGNHLVLNWSFYYAEFPSQFVLKEKQSETISLQDPAKLFQNISDLVSVAFDLRINGRAIQPEKIADLTIAPDKLCTAKVIYPGVPGGHLEVRAPVLQYLPPTYVINYSVFSLGLTNKPVNGDLSAQAGPFSQVIRYDEITSSGDWSLPLADSVSFNLFKSALRTAWINPNWIFIIVILLLVQEPRRVIALVSLLIFEWVLICVLRGSGHLQFPWLIPELLLGGLTSVLGGAANKWPQKNARLVLLALIAGFFNACRDVQQIRWTPENETSGALGGLSLGFVASIGLILLVVIPLIWECKKFREFDRVWAPKICWAIAALALLLPIQKWIFG
jgi:hypothetical protein